MNADRDRSTETGEQASEVAAERRTAQPVQTATDAQVEAARLALTQQHDEWVCGPSFGKVSLVTYAARAVADAVVAADVRPPRAVPAGGRCGFTVYDDADGVEGPCDRPATGWCWYQDVEHEDALGAACDEHENEGGRRMAALMAEVERLRALNRAQNLSIGEAVHRFTQQKKRAEAAEAKVAAAEALLAQAWTEGWDAGWKAPDGPQHNPYEEVQ